MTASRDRRRDYLMNYSLGMVLVAAVICCANFASAAPADPARVAGHDLLPFFPLCDRMNGKRNTG